MRCSFRLLAGLMACSLAFAAVGCGRSIHPVKGTVRYADGTPLGVGRVVVESDDGKTGSWGLIREDGTFDMGTMAPDDGVPAGTYSVFLTNTTTPPPAELNPNFVAKPLIHARFASKETSGITFEVPKQTTWDIVVEKP